VVPVADETDDALVERLRALAAVTDPLPAHVEEAARAAFETRTLDELARLVSDSADGEAVLTRAEPGAVRMLSFAVGEVAIDLQVEVADEVATVRGLLRGAAGPVTVEVRGRTAITAEVDAAGYFTATGLPGDVPAVRVRAAGTTTEWFAL
jgi:hypothetical protein